MSALSNTIRKFIHRMSFTRKIFILTTFISLTTLFIAGIIFIAASTVTISNMIKKDLVIHGKIIAENVNAALAFQDTEDANNILKNLQVITSLEEASIYITPKTLFAYYTSNNETPRTTTLPFTDGSKFSLSSVEVVTPIELDEKIIGYSYLRSTTEPIVIAFIASSTILTLALLFALLLAMYLGSRLQIFVTDPILQLSHTAKKIRDKHDYSVRTSIESTDEIGILAETFNEMLDNIEKRNVALQSSEEALRDIFNGIHDAIFIHDPDTGKTLDVNESALDITGYNREELLTTHIADLLNLAQETNQNRVISLFQQCISDGPQMLEFPFIHKEGRRIILEISLVKAELQGQTCVISVVRDTTERKHMEQKLNRAQRLESLGTLAGGIAHDFNNILQAITSSNALAQTELSSEHPVAHRLYDITTASKRATDLVKQILSLSRQEAFVEKDVDIADVVKEALKLLESTIPSTIEFKTTIQSQKVVRGDPTYIHQIVMNLCTNAFHAMENTGGILEVLLHDITVTTPEPELPLQSGAYTCLTVADTGHGMTQDVIDKIFDPYYTTKGPRKGTGLGLSVVDGIVKAMGGVVKVTSSSNQGTTFKVYFPSCNKHIDKTQSSHDTDPKSSLKILVVDDEELVASTCAAMLRRLKHSVEVTYNSHEALKLFQNQADSIDLVVTDMTMPKMTGLQLARELHIIKPNIPIILVTGFSEAITPHSLQEAGIKKVLMKPYQLRNLSDAINEAMTNHGQSTSS